MREMKTDFGRDIIGKKSIFIDLWTLISPQKSKIRCAFITNLKEATGVIRTKSVYKSKNKENRKRIPLPTSFYQRPAALVAWDLVGKRIINETTDGLVGGIIVETEAYLGKDDLACHVSRGLTPRNKIFYDSPPGTVYVFHLRGHYLFNVLTSHNQPLECVLIRAVEPTIGIEIMQQRRQADGENLTNGPAKLTKALGITKQENGSYITEGPVRIFDSDTNGFKRGVSPRIGISKDKDYPLRYFLVGNRFVSRPFKIK